MDQLVCSDNSDHQKGRETRMLQEQNYKARMLSSPEFKNCLLQAVEEGKRRMDEWILCESEQASSLDEHIICEGCWMDWQPEMTVVIPQTVDIRYPWDILGDAKE
jgi:hypothetical protein